MAEWTLVVSSRTPVDGWAGEARRVRALLDAVSACVVRGGYGALTWRCEDATAEQWRDMEFVAAQMEAEQLRYDVGTVMKGGGSSSVVLGYLPGASDSLVSVHYSAGGGGEWPFTSTLYFDDATPLHEHSVEWLVGLVNEAMTAVDGYHAWIGTAKLGIALTRARFDATGAQITLIPHRIDPALLPETMTVHPGPANRPDSMIVVADLELAAKSPDAVVPDLLKLDDLIRQSG